MNCIDCLEAGGKDFETLDENNYCPQCEKHYVLCARNACMMKKKKECVNLAMKIIVKSAVTI